MDQKRISVPSTGVIDGNQDGNSRQLSQPKLSQTQSAGGMTAAARHMTQTVQRPSTAGPPIQDDRNGIVVTKNVQRAPSANSEQSRHASKLAAEQRASSQNSQQRQVRENSAVNNYYLQNPNL